MKKEEFYQVVKDILTIKKYEIKEMLKDRQSRIILIMLILFLGLGIPFLYSIIKDIKRHSEERKNIENFNKNNNFRYYRNFSYKILENSKKR